MLIDTLIIMLNRAGYSEYKEYDSEVMFKTVYKYEKQLNVTFYEIGNALDLLEYEYLEYDENDCARLEEGALLKAIKNFDGNEESPIITAMCGDLINHD